MGKVLIAVDGTKASKAVLTTFHNSVQQQEEVVLLHVEGLGGRTMMIDMLGETELSALRDAVNGTEYKETRDRKAGKILDYYATALRDAGQVAIKPVIRTGVPADEILKVADEEGVELIIVGCSGRKGFDRIIAGSVGREVGKHARVPVLVAKRANICEEPYTWRDAVTAVSVTSAVLAGMMLLGIIL